MPPDYAEITESNQDLHAEIHEALRLMRKWDKMLTEFGPVLAQFRTPVGAAAAIRRSRRGNGNA